MQIYLDIGQRTIKLFIMHYVHTTKFFYPRKQQIFLSHIKKSFDADTTKYLWKIILGDTNQKCYYIEIIKEISTANL